MSRQPEEQNTIAAQAESERGAQVVPLFPDRDEDRALRVVVCADVIRMDPARLAALVRWLYG